MMLPTRDKDLQAAITAELKYCFDEGRYSTAPDYHWARETIETHALNKILQGLEERGYHAGLPPSIEEALNSGDGVYRP